ncbi:MAG: 50S ribosomal protein L16 [archaeon]
MARLRSFNAYRKLDRAYTRKSKYRKKSFIRANPTCKVIKFDIGNTSGVFSHQLDLFSKDILQIRDNALESARQTATRALEKTLGKTNFHLKIRAYPHQILREHSVASGAGADRFSTGMAKSFGHPAGLAARVFRNKPIMSVYVDEANIKTGRLALTRALHKLPCQGKIIVKKITA